MFLQNQGYVFPPFGTAPEQVSKYETAAPWPNESVAFTIANLPYPYPHTHEYYEIFVLLSGTILHTINNMQFVMNAGDCCLIRPEDYHWNHSSQSSNSEQILYVNFMCTKTAFDKIISIYPQLPIPSVEEDKSPLLFHLSSSYINNIKKLILLLQTPLIEPTPENVTICIALVSELVHTCIRFHASSPSDNYPPWLQSLIITMQNPESFSRKVSDIISGIPYSYSYIQKHFKRHVGTPPIEYFNSIKLAYAKEMLTNTQLSIISISSSLGFDSPAHLNHLFKKTFGLTPSQYRKQVASAAGVFSDK